MRIGTGWRSVGVVFTALLMVACAGGGTTVEGGGVAAAPKGEIELDVLNAGILLISLDTSGHIGIDLSSPKAQIPTPLGIVRLSGGVELSAVAKEHHAENILTICQNQDCQIYDLHKQEFEVSFQGDDYRAITVKAKNGNLLVNLISANYSSYEVGRSPSSSGRDANGSLAAGNQATIYTTNGSLLNLHESPAINSRTLVKLHNGLVVDVIGGPEWADGYTFWQVRIQEGTVGWVVESADGIQTLVAGVTSSSSAAGDCGGIAVRFTPGDTIVVSHLGDDLRILADINGDALELASSGDQLQILDGPTCFYSARYQQNMLYWYIYSSREDKTGWVADGIASERWLCPAYDYSCDG